MGCFKLHIEDTPRLSVAYSKKGQKPLKIRVSYYPFGLQQKGYNDVVTSNSNSMAERFAYNGKENNPELGLEWYDFGARNYDASLGRWMNIDPLADSFLDQTPYEAMLNNPISYIDPDGRFTVKAKDEQSQENIKNQLREEDRQYVQFDENGELNKELLNKTDSDSGNLKNLRILANSETTYTFSSSDNYEGVDANTGELITVELNPDIIKGITLFNEVIGSNTTISKDENVNVLVNNKESERETAKTTAHEIVHAVAFELKSLGYDPNHNYGFIGTDDDGVMILGDSNKVLKTEIKARTEEAYRNYDNK